MKWNIVALVAILGTASLATAHADGRQDFDLINKTGYTIDEVYISPSHADDWQNDVLGQDALGNGDRVHIRFARNAPGCLWDLRVVYDDKESAEWEEFDLCKTSKIIIRYNRKTGETSADYE